MSGGAVGHLSADSCRRNQRPHKRTVMRVVKCVRRQLQKPQAIAKLVAPGPASEELLSSREDGDPERRLLSFLQGESPEWMSVWCGCRSSTGGPALPLLLLTSTHHRLPKPGPVTFRRFLATSAVVRVGHQENRVNECGPMWPVVTTPTT